MGDALGPRGALRWIAWTAALLPSLPWLILLPGLGRLPNNDYYGILLQVLRPDGRWAPLRSFLAVRSNEHHVVLPTLLYALNVRLTHGDERALSAWSLLMVVATALLLVSLLPPALTRGRATVALAAGTLGVLLFVPAQAHSIVLGFSGTIWLTTNLLTAAAIVAFARHDATGSTRSLAALLALALLGAASYSTNLSLWPALLVAALAGHRRRRTVVALLAGAAAVYLWTIVSYGKPRQVTVPTRDPLTTAAFALRYLGAPFAGDPLVATLFGALALVASIALWCLLVRGGARWRPLLPWAMLQIYGLGNAVGTAVGRAGFGADFALQSRYASLAALFWIGLLVPLAAQLAAAVPAGSRPRAAALLASALALGVLAATVWDRGLTRLLGLVEASRTERLDVVHVHPVPPARPALRTVTPAPEEMWASMPTLRAARHVPFDRQPPLVLGEPVAATAPRDPRRVTGTLTSLRPTGGGVNEAAGWVQSRGPVEWILLVDGEGRLRGAGVPWQSGERGPQRPGFVTAWWQGYAPVGVELTAFARLAGDERAYPFAVSDRGARRAARREGRAATAPP
jgi:hypothetical protein